MEIFSVLKTLGDVAGTAKNFSDLIGMLSTKRASLPADIIDEDFQAKYNLLARRNISLASRIAELASEKTYCFSKAKLVSALEAIYEIETSISIAGISTTSAQAMEPRVQWLRNDRTVAQEKHVIAQVERACALNATWLHYQPHRLTPSELEPLRRATVYVTPSYIPEIVAIFSLSSRYDLKLNIQLHKSSFLESVETIIGQRSDSLQYIVGLDLSCVHAINVIKEGVTIIDILGTLRNKVLLPNKEFLLSASGNVYIPLGERSSSFNYATRRINDSIMKNAAAVYDFGALLNAIDKRQTSPHIGVAWSPYWQIMFAMGRGDIAKGGEFDNQPYSNWLLRLNGSQNDPSDTDLLFGALIRAEFRNLSVIRHNLAPVVTKPIADLKIADEVAAFMKLTII